MTEWDRAITTVVAYLRGRSREAAVQAASYTGMVADAYAATEVVSLHAAEAIEREFLGKPIPGGDDGTS